MSTIGQGPGNRLGRNYTRPEFLKIITPFFADGNIFSVPIKNSDIAFVVFERRSVKNLREKFILVAEISPVNLSLKRKGTFI